MIFFSAFNQNRCHTKTHRCRAGVKNKRIGSGDKRLKKTDSWHPSNDNFASRSFQCRNLLLATNKRWTNRLGPPEKPVWNRPRETDKIIFWVGKRASLAQEPILMLVFSQLTTSSTEAFVATFVFFSDSQFFLQNVSEAQKSSQRSILRLTSSKNTLASTTSWNSVWKGLLDKIDKKVPVWLYRLVGSVDLGAKGSGLHELRGLRGLRGISQTHGLRGVSGLC